MYIYPCKSYVLSFSIHLGISQLIGFQTSAHLADIFGIQCLQFGRCLRQSWQDISMTPRSSLQNLESRTTQLLIAFDEIAALPETPEARLFAQVDKGRFVGGTLLFHRRYRESQKSADISAVCIVEKHNMIKFVLITNSIHCSVSSSEFLKWHWVPKLHYFSMKWCMNALFGG